jgi:integrase
MEVSLYLKRPKSKKETAIFARISYYGLRLKYYLPEKILPKYWNKEAHLARETKSFSEYGEFNERLKNITSDIKTIIRKYMNDNNRQLPAVAILKQILDTEIKFLNKAPKQGFFEFYQSIIDQSEKGLRINHKTGKPITKGTPKVYTTVLNHLKQFQIDTKCKVDFDTIDLEFYTNYTEYLTKKAKLSLNTIGKNIQTIKLILNEATEQGLNTNLKYKSKRFVTQREEAENIYLNEKELKDLANHDLSENKSLERVRDLFLIGCYTGLRYSDFSILQPKNIKNGFIEINQSKTGAPVVIPVHSTVKEMLRKYSHELPRALTNQKMNSYLKDIAKEIKSLKQNVSIGYTKGGQRIIENCPKWELVTTHTARRSFATNEFKAGTPTLTIMAITGHKTEKAFLKYIKVTSKEHAQILKATWAKRLKTKAKTIALTA